MPLKPQDRMRAPERMRDVMRGALGSSLKSMPPEDRMAAAWPVACGQKIAERTRVTGLEGAVLTVEVADTAWLQQMRSMSEKLKHDLRRIAGVDVTDILFKLAANDKQ
jgi:predicted nucleic acid-binding Zn ribbon protein